MKIILLVIALALCEAIPASAQKKLPGEMDKCDPYMTAQGGYGYLAENGPKAAVWWAEGINKVMKDTPVARRKGATVKLNTARNEYESFIVVVNPKEDLRGLKVAVEGLPEGITASIRKVEYVTTYYTNDSYGWPGEWPDPLPLYDAPADAPAEENNSFWITLKTPAGHAAGSG